MADNIGVTPGSGATVSTDEVSNLHYQEVKLVDGRKGQITPVRASASNELWTLGHTDLQVVNKTISGMSTTVYAAGDAIGVVQSSAVFAFGEYAILRAVKIADKDAQNAAIDIVFIDDETLAVTDNAAFAPSDAYNNASISAVVSIAASDYKAWSGNSIAVKNDLWVPYYTSVVTTGQTSFVLVSRGTPTYPSASPLHVTLWVEYVAVG